MPRHPRFAPGLALILVVGVLAMLGILAVAFVTLSNLERRSAHQRVHQSKALLLARSGIEDALARLGAGQDGERPETRYLGEDWDADGLLGGWEDSDELFRDGKLDRDVCPVTCAMRPHFSVLDGLGRPALVSVDGWRRGYSGGLGDQAHYALKLKTGGIHVNGGDPAAPLQEPGIDIFSPPIDNYNAMLRRILGHLAEALDREDGQDDAVPVDREDGFRLIDDRPRQGWQSVDEISAVLGWEKTMHLEPYLALEARVDRKVIRPSFACKELEGTSHSRAMVMHLGHFVPDPGRRSPDFERIPVLGAGGKVIGRAPVSLPWARRRPAVLLALLSDLKGLYLDDAAMRSRFQADRIGTLKAAVIQNSGFPGDDAHQAAQAIQEWDGSLDTWQSWDALCESMMFTGSSDLVQAKRDLLKANFNPNSDLNRFNPNRSLWRSVDKLDLMEYAPEWALQPHQGGVVTSVGRLLGEGGRVLAARTLSVTLGGLSWVRITTQREFVCRGLGDLDVAGDEVGVRLPGASGPPVATPSAGPDRTWGHALAVPAISGRGVSLQSYPEPCVDDGSGLSLQPADYDGNLQLATVETSPDECYVTAVTQDQKLLARFTSRMDLDVADATLPPFSNPNGASCLPDIGMVATTELRHGLFQNPRSNTLYPDGCYAEAMATPAYWSAGNMDGYHGLLSFWVKPNHRLPKMQDKRGHPYVRASNVRGNPSGGSDVTQVFFLGDAVIPQTWGGDGHGVAPASVPFVAQFEIGHDDSDVSREHRFNVPSGEASPHRWRLVSFQWDFRSPDRHDTGDLLVDDGIHALNPASLHGLYDLYPGAAGNEPLAASDLTVPDVNGSHRIWLGGTYPSSEGSTTEYLGSGADATFDEFAIYDFGGAGPGGIPANPAGGLPSHFARNRFVIGRYYKESGYLGLLDSSGSNHAGRWFSALVDLGEVRIRSLAWTQVVPRGLLSPRGSEPEDGDDAPDGRILLELADPMGEDYLHDAQGRPIDTAFEYAGGHRVGRGIASPFRLHAIFRPNLSDPENTPILDSLTLNDVTVFYEPLSGRTCSGWREVL